MKELNITGGARIGVANATWPFASLKVTEERLELNATILGNFVFKPEDIISIEPYFMIPFLGQGIKINHKLPKYNQKIIFWAFKNPNQVIRQIKQTGFLDNLTTTKIQDKSDRIEEMQKQGGFLVRISFAIGIVLMWNFLFVLDFINFYKGGSEGVPIGIGAIVALGLVFISCLLTLVSGNFRKIVLKKGRDVKDISRFLYFIMFISGVMMISILTFPK